MTGAVKKRPPLGRPTTDIGLQAHPEVGVAPPLGARTHALFPRDAGRVPFSGRDNAGATEQVSRLRDGESAGFDAVERAALPFPTHKNIPSYTPADILHTNGGGRAGRGRRS